MSFTPDGYLVAAANWNKVLIWNAEAGGLPKAASKGVLGKVSNGSLTNGNGASEEEDDLGADDNCSLSWDAESGKLALGFGSQVSTTLWSGVLVDEADDYPDCDYQLAALKNEMLQKKPRLLQAKEVYWTIRSIGVQNCDLWRPVGNMTLPAQVLVSRYLGYISC